MECAAGEVLDLDLALSSMSDLDRFYNSSDPHPLPHILFQGLVMLNLLPLLLLCLLALVACGGRNAGNSVLFPKKSTSLLFSFLFMNITYT